MKTGYFVNCVGLTPIVQQLFSNIFILLSFEPGDMLSDNIIPLRESLFKAVMYKCQRSTLLNIVNILIDL
jgi:hypothetical protein